MGGSQGLDKTLCNFALAIARALEYMHHGLDDGYALIHRDVKPENILLTNDSVAKLADLGEARYQNRNIQNEATVMSMVGTLYYVAPEIILGDEYNEKVDVYSFGILLNEMNTKFIPYTSGKICGFQKRLVVRQKNTSDHG